MELFWKFVDPDVKEKENAIGVIGATPLNLSSVTADETIRHVLKEEGYDHVYCYGMGDGLDTFKKSSFGQEKSRRRAVGIKGGKIYGKNLWYSI